MEIILASHSPYRKQLLQQLGFSFQAIKPEVDERQLENNYHGHIEDLAEFLAKEKAQYIFKKFPKSLVIGCDQTLIFKGRHFSKPETPEAVFQRLQTMQGQVHELHTGLCVLSETNTFSIKVAARMQMRTLSEKQIHNYIQLDQPMGCAGGYKIEKHGILLFEHIDTEDYFSIIGLPILSLISILEKLGVSRL